jgi:hypothetical protein
MAPPRFVVATFDAVGGPAALAKADDGYYAGPTDAGTYRLLRCGKHSSPSYPVWSKIRWGSAIKEEGGAIKVMHDGKWQLLSKLVPAMTKKMLIDRNMELYGKNTLPTEWRFNDFGHMTCYFFKDKNNNRKFDKGETMSKEYFHTTPDDEASAAQGKPVVLTESHGCIHLKPNDIDDMIAKKYLAQGNKVVVHKYDVTIPKDWSNDAKATAPFEVHFFPGEKKVLVTGAKPKPGK